VLRCHDCERVPAVNEPLVRVRGRRLCRDKDRLEPSALILGSRLTACAVTTLPPLPSPTWPEPKLVLSERLIVILLDLLVLTTSTISVWGCGAKLRTGLGHGVQGNPGYNKVCVELSVCIVSVVQACVLVLLRR